jgi:CBS-domain-containing membrane protein
MTRHPVMVAPDLPAAEAERIMAENHIRHLPVVEDGKRLVGLVTRQRFSLKPDVVGSYDVWEITRNLASLKVKRIMIPAKQVYTVNPDLSIERAAAMMSECKVGCLPVIEEKNIVVGIVTEIDLLESFQLMLGLPTEGVRATVSMPNQKGEFAKLMQVLADQEWGVMGIGTFPNRRREGYYYTVVKITGVEPDEVMSALNAIDSQEVVDIRTVV